MTASNALFVSSLPKPSILIDSKEIEKKAADDALAGHPASDSREPGPVEQGIIDSCQGAYQELNRKATEILEYTLADFEANEKLSTQRDFEAAEQHSDANVEGYLQDAKQRILALQTDQVSASAYWRYFRDKHKIDREARYPASHKVHWAMLGLFVLVECVLNSLFFAESQALGIVGGLFIAIFFSIANILSGYAAGRYLFPLAAHDSQFDHLKRQRWKGQVGIALWTVIIVGLHFLLAHYRDLSSLREVRALYEAPAHALQHPFELSILSIVMFLIGVLLSAFAFVDGSQWDDRCPDYGHVDRRYKESAAALHAAIESTRQEVAARIRAATVESTGLRRTAESRLDRLGAIAASVEPLRKKYEESRSKISDTCRNLLVTYRDKNKFIRGAQQPPPAYYDAFPVFASELDLAGTASFPARIAVVKAEVARIGEWDSVIHKNERDRLQKGGKYLDGFLDQIKSTAQEAAVVPTP